MKKEVTVAIPVFNGEKFILEALESIVEQTRPVDHIVVCDNQSTDKTVSIINQFKSKYKDIDIQLHINHANIGNIKNYNKCLKLCSSDYLLILSSDDKLKPKAISKLAAFLNDHPNVAFVVGEKDFFDESGNIIETARKKQDRIFKKGEVMEFILATGMWIQHSSTLFNTKYTNEIGLWDPDYIGGDERFYAAVVQKFPIALLGDSLIFERKHLEQLGKKELLRFKDKLMHFKKNIQIADIESNDERRKKTKKILKKWVGSQCIVIGRKVWKNEKKPLLALKYWIYGLIHNPAILFQTNFLKTIARSLLNK